MRSYFKKMPKIIQDVLMLVRGLMKRKMLENYRNYGGIPIMRKLFQCYGKRCWHTSMDRYQHNFVLKSIDH